LFALVDPLGWNGLHEALLSAGRVSARQPLHDWEEWCKYCVVWFHCCCINHQWTSVQNKLNGLTFLNCLIHMLWIQSNSVVTSWKKLNILCHC